MLDTIEDSIEGLVFSQWYNLRDSEKSVAFKMI